MSRLILVELSDLPREPHGCPPEAEQSRARRVTNPDELRAGQHDMRGAVFGTHHDQARAVRQLHRAPGRDKL